MDLTTLQLAEKIARAVLKDVDCDEISLASHDSYFDPLWTHEWGTIEPDLTWAVLKVLHETGSWFCRLEETPQGTIERAYEQIDLFSAETAADDQVGGSTRPRV